MKLNRRTLMQWAGKLTGAAWLGGSARAQSVPFVDLALTPDGSGLWVMDQMGRIYTLGAAPVFSDPPEPPRPSPYVALVSTPTGGGLYALRQDGQLRTFGDASNLNPLV